MPMTSRYVSAILVLLCSAGCSQSTKFYGTISTPETTWTTHSNGSRIQGRTNTKTDDHILLVQSQNDEIGKWCVIAETNKENPRVWLLLRKIGWKEFNTAFANEYQSLETNFDNAHEIYGEISIKNCSSSSSFHVFVNAASEDQ